MFSQNNICFEHDVPSETTHWVPAENSNAPSHLFPAPKSQERMHSDWVVFPKGSRHTYILKNDSQGAQLQAQRQAQPRTQRQERQAQKELDKLKRRQTQAKDKLKALKLREFEEIVRLNPLFAWGAEMD